MKTNTENTDLAAREIDTYLQISQDYLNSMFELKNTDQLAVEYHRNYHILSLLLTHITDKKNEIIEELKESGRDKKVASNY